MFARVEAKLLAKQQIRGNLGILLAITIVLMIIPVLLGRVSVIGRVLEFLVSPIVTMSITLVYLKVTAGVKPEISDTLLGLPYFVKALVLTILVGIFTFLWSLLFLIPGIIKGLSYSQACNILAENPDMTPMEALNESKRIMNGHKMDLFILGLSFFGWALVGVITLGLAYIYIAPYMQATTMNFYHAIKGVPEYGDSVGATAY